MQKYSIIKIVIKYACFKKNNNYKHGSKELSTTYLVSTYYYYLASLYNIWLIILCYK